MPRLLVFLPIVVLAVSVQAQSGNDLFQKALSKERVDGQFAEAITLYERIVKDFASDRALAAKALVQIGRCYERLGKAEANRAYERVVQEFADQKASSAEARARLALLRGAPAAPAGIITRQLWKDAPIGGTLRIGKVSPDGRHLVVWDPKVGLALRAASDAAGADRIVLPASAIDVTREGASGLWAICAPTGKQIAYSWFNGTRFDLRVIDVAAGAAGTPRVLYANEDIDWIAPYDWSPDGNWIAVQVQRQDRTAQIGLLSASGSLRVLKSVDWQASTNLAFSPDGQFLAFDLPASGGTGQRDIFLLATDGSRQIAAVIDRSNDRVVGWTPEGKHLMFISDRSGSGGLWSMAIQGGQPVGLPALVKPDFGDASVLGLARSGALFVRTATGAPRLSIASVDFESGKLLASPPIQSIGAGAAPAWSPDGRHLATVLNIGKTEPVGAASGNEFVTVAIRDIATAQTRELHPQLAYFSEVLRWSPDGRSLLGPGLDGNAREGIYRVDIETGRADAILSIAPDQRLSYPQWLPDGKRIVYLRGARNPRGRIEGDKIVVERDVESGAEREVMRDANMSLGPFAVSPDSRSLAYTTYDAATNQSALMIRPLDGGEPRMLLQRPLPTLIRNIDSWLPDSGGIVFTIWRQQERLLEPWLISREGGSPIRLELGRSADSTQVHPDGRQVVFRTPVQSPAQVWVLENLTPPSPSTTKAVRR